MKKSPKNYYSLLKLETKIPMSSSQKRKKRSRRRVIRTAMTPFFTSNKSSSKVA